MPYLFTFLYSPTSISKLSGGSKDFLAVVLSFNN